MTQFLIWDGDLRLPAEARQRANARLATPDDVRRWAFERGFLLAPAPTTRHAPLQLVRSDLSAP